MPDSKDRMMQQHPRSGKAHYLPDFLSHLRLVTMHLTVTAECLFLHKRTLLAAHPCIVREFLTVRAHPPPAPAVSFMLLPAVQADHLFHHVLLLLPFLLDLPVLHIAVHRSIPPLPEGTSALREPCGSL